MNLVLFCFIISSLVIFITFSSCQDDLFPTMKTQPRVLQKIQILNPKKFLKVRSNEKQKWNLKKRVDRRDAYTVFPAIVNRPDNVGVPDSPFFQPDIGVEQKVRVKKVLPDYYFAIGRRKRSVKNDSVHIKNVTAKIIIKNTKANITKRYKTKALNITRQKSKQMKRNKKRKLTTKINVDSTTVRLKYSTKNRKPDIRNKGERVEREKPREERIQKNYKKISRNMDRKKRTRQAKRGGRRLIAGKDALISEYPYTVSIQKGNEHWCAGALLNPRLVITTANCVWKSQRTSRLKVRAGSRHVDRGGQMAKIQEVMKHPKWSIRSKPDNDVALLLLDRKIKFSDTVHSVDLPNRAMRPAFDDAWVTSWGAERRDGRFEKGQVTLQVYSSRLMDLKKCNNVTQRFGVSVSDNFICLAQTGNKAPCTRDTGAPAVSDGVVWGLASWGIRKLCGTERFPAMFSYLASPSNLDFITNATHYLMSEQRYYPFPDRFPVQREHTKPTTVSKGIDYA